MSKLFIKEYNKTRSNEIMKLGSWRLGTLVRVITGHNALNYFRSKVDVRMDETCRFCEESEETVWHFVNDCPVFLQKRREILKGESAIGDEWRVEEIMEMAEFCKINAALMGDDNIYYEDIDSDGENSPDPEPD